VKDIDRLPQLLDVGILGEPVSQVLRILGSRRQRAPLEVENALEALVLAIEGGRPRKLGDLRLKRPGEFAVAREV